LISIEVLLIIARKTKKELGDNGKLVSTKTKNNEPQGYKMFLKGTNLPKIR